MNRRQALILEYFRRNAGRAFDAERVASDMVFILRGLDTTDVRREIVALEKTGDLHRVAEGRWTYRTGNQLELL